jgi:hypothetical protein
MTSEGLRGTMKCSKSPTGEHAPYSMGISYSTCINGPNKGTDVVTCSWCGLGGVQAWHEEARPVKGHGPFATTLVRVNDSLEWPT